MNLNDFYNILEKIKVTYDTNTFLINIFCYNTLILLIIFCYYFDIHIRETFNNKKYFLLFILDTIMIFLLQIFIGNIILILPFVSFFASLIIQKRFDIFSKTEITIEDEKDEDKPVIVSKLHHEPKDEISVKIKKIGKDNNFNILDVLYIYDYISDYQRRKIIQSMISEHTDVMADKLLTTYTISEEELKEARAILNLIDYEGRIVTKEEAIYCLLKNKKEMNRDD